VWNLPHSKIKESIASILKKEGYINDFAVEGKIPKTIKLKLKISGQKRASSKVFRRVQQRRVFARYVGATDIPRVRNGLGSIGRVYIRRAVMTGTQAAEKRILAANCSATSGRKEFLYVTRNWKNKPHRDSGESKKLKSRARPSMSKDPKGQT